MTWHVRVIGADDRGEGTGTLIMPNTCRSYEPYLASMQVSAVCLRVLKTAEACGPRRVPFDDQSAPGLCPVGIVLSPYLRKTDADHETLGRPRDDVGDPAGDDDDALHGRAPGGPPEIGVPGHR